MSEPNELSRTQNAASRPDAGQTPDVTDPNSIDTKTMAFDSALLPSVPTAVAIAGYEIVRELGRGGMGVVYQARHLGLHRLVAIKMIVSGGHAGGYAIARFRAEAEAVARMHHANIVQVYEIGVSAGLPFFSLEFVDGGSLADQLRGTPSTPGDAARLVEVLAQAMAYAHEQGVVHRDLKPANVLLMKDGTPKIADFGLAKQMDSQSGLTHTGTVVGTPSYMAPEQAQGKTKEVGPPVDIYALGAILYEMLTGRPPFRAATPLDTVMQVIHEEPVPPRQLQSKLPRDLETICLKCLQKEPHKRYASASALADDLGRYRSDQPILARPVGRVERTWRWCRRNPGVASLLGVVAACIVVAAALLNQERTETLRNLARAKEAERNLLAQLKLTEAAEREKTEKLWQSLLDQARARRLSRKMGQRFKSLEALAEAAKIARERKMPAQRFELLRNEAIACMAMPDLRVVKELGVLPEESTHVDLDEELKVYARMDRQGTCYVSRVADGVETARIPGVPDKERTVDLSPDGRNAVLWYYPNGPTQLWRLDEAKPRLLFEHPGRPQFGFSPDSQMLGLGIQDGAIQLLELPSGRELRRLQSRPLMTSLVVNAKQKQLCVCIGHKLVQLAALDTGDVLAEFTMPVKVDYMACDMHGRTLAAAGADRKIYLWDLTTRKLSWVLEGHKNHGILVAFNHGGDFLASHDWNNAFRLWNVNTGQLAFLNSMRAHLRFSRDDRLIPAWNGQKLALSEVAFGRTYRTLGRRAVLGPGRCFEPAVNPDGRLLAIGMEDGVGLWDIVSGRQLEFLKLGITYHLLFEPSGALLTNSPTGLQRWPIEAGPAGADLPRIGPAQRLPLPGSGGQIAQSKDGQILAIAQSKGAIVWHRAEPERTLTLGPHADVRYVSVSPDGRWVATGSHNGTGCKVWDAQTGKLVKDLLPNAGGTRVSFSPDGRWLATGVGGSRLWAVDTWLEGPKLGGTLPVFSRDGRLLAHATQHGVLQVLDAATRRELGRLEDPNGDGGGEGGESGAFSPDGTLLITTNHDSGSIHIWDLRAIRAELAALGLDWD